MSSERPSPIALWDQTRGHDRWGVRNMLWWRLLVQHGYVTNDVDGLVRWRAVEASALRFLAALDAHAPLNPTPEEGPKP